MSGIQHLSLFIISGLLLNIAPGPDSLLVMTRSATQGWRAGSVASIGIGAGICIHVVAAALGLSAVLATSATAFAMVKYIGAAYLVYIGAAMLMQRRPRTPAVPVVSAPVDSSVAGKAALSYRRIFMQGFLTNALNPKVAIFFLAFVPQFIMPDAPGKALAFLILGAIFNLNGMLWCHVLVFLSVFASRRLRPRPGMTLWLGRGIGVLFIALGVRLALAARN